MRLGRLDRQNNKRDRKERLLLFLFLLFLVLFAIASCPRNNSGDAQSRLPVREKEACHKKHESAGAIAEASSWGKSGGSISLFLSSI